ncbi:MAG: hypothetical protein Unbinned838contig1000_43 [Prokaryotic dsDNA virus sp.]|nr:MAG: hypothetical protein Unbinned838contig1000_43 [Prokaryotic dsDNA virus sp.]|tara:strand:+ start:1163 stop:1495 length:333 start_codon:yes stop_codon:yes gene_type:complete
MAITDNSRLVSAINKQSNSTDPGCGCGAQLVRKGQALPAGDYVMMKGLAAAPLILSNIVWKGEPWNDSALANNAPVTTLNLDLRYSMSWEMNIESCDVAGADAVFYKRCK